MGAPFIRGIAGSVVLLAASAACFGVHAQGNSVGKLPTTTTESLSDKSIVLPRDLPAERTLLLVAFERDQRAALATWKKGLDLAAGKTPWIELVVVGPQNAFVHTMIVRGLRREIAEGPTRDRIAPVFAEQTPYAQSLGLSAVSAHALIVDRTGKVLAYADGEYSPAKAQPRLSSLTP